LNRNVGFIFRGVLLDPRSSLTAAQRGAAVALFEHGWGARAAATHLGVSRWAVRALYRRWGVHGMGALVGKASRATYPFEFKLDVVRQFIDDGITAQQLAREYELSSSQLVQAWVRAYRRHGEDGLRPQPKGRRPKGVGPPTPGEVSDLERLQRENLRLRAENAYLKKLRALRAQGRQ
jgi:transposase-like protein